MKRNKTTLIAMVVGFLCISLVVGIYLFDRDLPLGEQYKTVDQYGGPFTLHSGDGAVSLSDFKGKVVVAYFGFLNCTEACPASMAVLNKAFKKLSEDELNQIQALFISVDPERDSIEDLKAFTEYYGGKVMALTDTPTVIDKLTNQYGVFFELVDLEGSAMNYTVDHSSRFYMIDRNGKLITTMSHSTTPTELAHRMRRLLERPVQSSQSSLN